MSDTGIESRATQNDTRRIHADRLLGRVPWIGRQLIHWYTHLGLLQRLVLGSVLGVLGGSTFIAFINTYAVYRYAFRYDVRIPVEGVPYLALAASVLSCFFLVGALMCAIPVYGLLRLMTALTRVVVHRIQWALGAIRPVRGAEARVTRELIAIDVLTGIFSAITTLAISLKFSVSFPSNRVEFPNPVVIVTVGLALVGLTALSIRPNWVKWVPFALTFVLVTATSIALFFPSFYAARLRQIRYGGGTPITLVCEGGRLCEPSRTLHLFLITSDTYLVYDDASKEIIEVPVSEVNRVRYLRTGPVKLPGIIKPEPFFQWPR